MGDVNGSYADYQEVCRRFIKAEMVKRGLHWDDVVRDLATVGIELSSANLRRMVSMGTVRATVLLALIHLYDIRTATSNDISQQLENIRRYPVNSSQTS